MNDSAVIEILRSVGYELYSSGLHGCEAKATHLRNERMWNPEPGDVVLETSTFYTVRSGKQFWATPEDTVGVLDKITSEPISIEWDEPSDGPWPMEKVWYINRFRDGELVRWTNANFVAISWPEVAAPRGRVGVVVDHAAS